MVSTVLYWFDPISCTNMCWFSACCISSCFLGDLLDWWTLLWEILSRRLRKKETVFLWRYLFFHAFNLTVLVTSIHTENVVMDSGVEYWLLTNLKFRQLWRKLFRNKEIKYTYKKSGHLFLKSVFVSFNNLLTAKGTIDHYLSALMEILVNSILPQGTK